MVFVVVAVAVVTVVLLEEATLAFSFPAAAVDSLFSTSEAVCSLFCA